MAIVSKARGYETGIATARAGVGLDIARSNLRLMAAAPDLLEGGKALDQLVEEMQFNVGAYLEPGIDFDADALINKLIYLLDGPEQREAQGKLRAAIAKARGDA